MGKVFHIKGIVKDNLKISLAYNLTYQDIEEVKIFLKNAQI